jgi:hypothetical protein
MVYSDATPVHDPPAFGRLTVAVENAKESLKGEVSGREMPHDDV